MGAAFVLDRFASAPALAELDTVRLCVDAALDAPVDNRSGLRAILPRILGARRYISLRGSLSGWVVYTAALEAHCNLLCPRRYFEGDEHTERNLESRLNAQLRHYMSA